MTRTAQLIRRYRLPEIRIVRRAMDIVAIGTGDAARIHQALDEVVSLHPVLVRRTVGKVRKRLRA
jgi:hypothetical protein